MATTLVRIALLSRSSTAMASSDPVLLDGELAVADTGSSRPTVKIGDGARHWSTLPALMSNAPDYVAGPTVTLPPGSPATVVIDNVANPPTISFGIPAGADGAAAAGGADTDIQFRDGGKFAGDARFTWSKVTGTQTTVGHVLITGAGSSPSALQVNGAAGLAAAFFTAGAGSFAIQASQGPSALTNNGLPLLLFNHAGASGYSTLQNDSSGNWSIGYTAGSGLALGTPIIKWNTAGNVVIPKPSAGAALSVAALSGSGPAISTDVTGGANALVATNGAFSMVQGIDAAGVSYMGAFGNKLTFGIGGSTDVTLATDHGMFMAGATGGSKGAGTFNATQLYVNGVAVELGGGGNPTAKVGVAVVNGVAATFMRSDAAPPIDLAMVPTWTGVHTFTGGANPVVINGTDSAGNGVLAVNQTGGTGVAFAINKPGGGTTYINMNSGGDVFNIGVDNAAHQVAITAWAAGSKMTFGVGGTGVLTINPDGTVTSSIAGGNTLAVISTSAADGVTSRVQVTANATACALFCANAAQSTAIVVGGPTGAQSALRNLGAYPLVFGTANKYRGQVTAAGNWIMAAPDSGTALSVKLFAGANGIDIDASAGAFNAVQITSQTGVIFGISAFNNIAFLNVSGGVSASLQLGTAGGSVTINALGNVLVAAPTSGNALQVTAVASGRCLTLIGAGGGASAIAMDDPGGPFIQWAGGGSVFGWLGSGAQAQSPAGNLLDLAMVTNTASNQLILGTNKVARLTITGAGASKFSGALSMNNAAPYAGSAGWGTPTGGGVIANFPGASATLVQCSNTISTLLAILKAFGMVLA